MRPVLRKTPLVALLGAALVCGGCKPPAPTEDAQAADAARRIDRRDDGSRRDDKARPSAGPTDARRDAPPDQRRRPRDDEPRDTLQGALAEAMKMLGSFAKGADDLLGGGAQPADVDHDADARAVVVHLVLEGVSAEIDAPFDFFGPRQLSLKRAIDTLDKAARDPKVAAILVEPTRFAGGSAKIQAVRRAIESARAAGKRVFAFLSEPMAAEYLIATAAEEIAISPTGMWLVTGARAEALYVRDLLAMVGLQFDAVAIGEYKTAAETLTRDRMSKEMREVLDAILDERMGALVSATAGARKIDPTHVTAAIDEAPLTAQEALSRKLVDTSAYRDDFVKAIGAKLGIGDNVRLVRDYGKKKRKLDLSSIFSLSSLFGRKKDVSTGKPKVAVVYALGPIFPGRGRENPFFEDRAVFAEQLIETLGKVKADPDVKAVVLRIDSPGGSATASDQIWHAVEDLKTRVPVVASFSDVAASGGYYIAAGANAIVAEPGTLTGSIGVIGGKIVTEGLARKVRVNREVVTRGKNSGLFSGAAAFASAERAALERVMKSTYQEFLARVAHGRKMDVTKVETLARGRVWTGLQAKANGLVDQIGSLAAAVDVAKGRAGLVGPAADVEIVVYPKEKSILDWLQEGMGTSLRHLLSRRAALDVAADRLGLGDVVEKWAQVGEMPPPWAIMPLAISIR